MTELLEKEAPATKPIAWPGTDIFYQIYPLGLLGAPGIDNPNQARTWRSTMQKPVRTLQDLRPWIDHAAKLGCTGLYLGPVFQSTSHGYDTIDYFQVDDRLGTNQDLQILIEHCHARGIKVLLDAVFNHVGRDFFAFQDLLDHGQNSMFKQWFTGLDFSKTSPCGDAFSYNGWNGHYDLVQLNSHWQWVREHLFAAVDTWITQFKIDGLRLDAADCLDADFLTDLATHCHRRKADFCLLSEAVHGDYRALVRADGSNAVSNYEAYKSLWSSLNDGNFFELAWTLNRQIGPDGMYRNVGLYNFIDNHDVNRIASVLKKDQHLPMLYSLMFCLAGSPSIYYGSEWGLKAERLLQSDKPLRPTLCFDAHGCPCDIQGRPAPGYRTDLIELIQHLGRIRQANAVFSAGDYRQVMVSHQQIAFMRSMSGQRALIVANSADCTIQLKLHEIPDWQRQGSNFDSTSISQGKWTIALGPAINAQILQDHGYVEVPANSVLIALANF